MKLVSLPRSLGPHDFTSPCTSFSALRFSVNVEHALPVPGIGIRIILHRPQAPFCGARNEINRNPSQETNLLPLHINTFDQHFDVGRITLTVHLCLKPTAGRQRLCSGRQRQVSRAGGTAIEAVKIRTAPTHRIFLTANVSRRIVVLIYSKVIFVT